MKFKPGDIIRSRTVPEITVMVLNVKNHWTNHKMSEPGYELIIINDPREKAGRLQKYGLPESLAIVEYDLVSNKTSETPKNINDK